MSISSSEKVYPKQHAVFQNRIIDLYKNMSLDEKRLLVLLSPIVRTTKTKEGQPVFISANEYAKECGVSLTRAYEGLADASERLVRRYFSYINTDGKKTAANWIIRSTYDQGGVDVFFTNEVLTMLQTFDKLNPYTKYKKEIILNLKGDYAFEIYHIAKQSEGLGKADILLENLKENLELPKSYHDLSNLKKRVLDPSCKEITQNTDLNLTYETMKRGRTVIGIRFLIENKTPKESNVGNKQHDSCTRLTKLQVVTYAKKLANDADFGSKYAQDGEEMPDFIFRLTQELSKPEKINKYMHHMIRLGFRKASK